MVKMSEKSKRTLIYSIIKFLNEESKQESLSIDSKNKLFAAVLCLESNYEIKVPDENSTEDDTDVNWEEILDKDIDLLSLVNEKISKKNSKSVRILHSF